MGDRHESPTCLQRNKLPTLPTQDGFDALFFVVFFCFFFAGVNVLNLNVPVQ